MKKPAREEFLEGRVKQQEATIAHLTALVHELLDRRERREAALIALPPRHSPTVFDLGDFDATDTLPAGIRADDLILALDAKRNGGG